MSRYEINPESRDTRNSTDILVGLMRTSRSWGLRGEARLENQQNGTLDQLAPKALSTLC